MLLSWHESTERAAAELVGTPYREDGWDTKGFACWPLVHYVFGLAGMVLPHDVYHACVLFEKATPPYRALDIVFFQHHFIPMHLGVMINSLEVLHSSSATNGVAKRSLSRAWYRMTMRGVHRLRGNA